MIGMSSSRATASAFRRRGGIVREIKRHWDYYIMMLPALAVLFFFAYLPYRGMTIAFQNFNFVDKYNSPFVGLANFKFLFTSPVVWRITYNTLFININYLIWTTIASVAAAVALNQLRSGTGRKIYQNAIFIPYFFSAVIFAKLINNVIFVDSAGGIANQIVRFFGGKAVAWQEDPNPWAWIIIGTRLWQWLGYSSIIYLASIAGIDQELLEASGLDGAGRWQQIWHIIIPHLIPTIIIMSLLKIGDMLRGDFNTIYSIINTNGILYTHTDIIDTYVFRAIKDAADFGPTQAVSLYQSVVGFILVFGSNALVKRYNKDYALF